MIALAASNGRLLKVLSGDSSPSPYGFHQVFGWISENDLVNRLHRRQIQGLKTTGDWLFKFIYSVKADGTVAISNADQCSFTAGKLKTPIGEFQFLNQAIAPELSDAEDQAEQARTKKFYRACTILALVLCSTLPFIHFEQAQLEPEVLEPVVVKIIPEVQKDVRVPEAAIADLKAIPKVDQVTKRAIQQNLGFLGFLGRKDLTKAMGGVPTQLSNTSPGAGPGGKEGSGGEYLVGLGQGVKRATVGNTGMAGLGGVGTKGAGGGAGGYGNTMIGSGEGRGLSKIALSNEMVLEGGLDRAVIQATIAKYLSQVRACYEGELQKNAGLAGLVTMSFVISGQGTVSASNASKSTLGSPVVESCITERLKTWQFPKPVGGVNVKVNYPFMLRPMGT